MTISDRALLERALIGMEEVMARLGTPEGASLPTGTPAHGATTLCLTAAMALVDVAQALLRDPAALPADGQTADWQTIIGHTKNASRTAHQAVLLLAAQRNFSAARGAITVAADGGAAA
ncbi:hypothetical protein QTI66_14875 [Variovorax sp. J22R133]|uniref:hypothetical protein n=1 Tax=Variovorax brevis TaxID=3053503 RepID=UPI0025776F0D|nr:hypothetical protein [Variovorax sp. J22R133]MDM0113440.1 hypothetical protein [Variovorax sp. J22R133]